MDNKNNKQKYISDNKIEKKVTEYKKAIFRVDEVEENSIIINVNGWRMRVGLVGKMENVKDITAGRNVEVEYIGDIINPDIDTPQFKPMNV